MNELHPIFNLSSWFGSKHLLDEGERADGCWLQPCRVLAFLARTLWEPAACPLCVGVPVVPLPHSSASWLVEITVRAAQLSEPSVISTIAFPSLGLLFMWVSSFQPSSNPMFLSTVIYEDDLFRPLISLPVSCPGGLKQ